MNPSAPPAATDFDLLVVGGGINGAGVARDAAGRGVRTALIDQDDFGGATSSASTKLIHGGLRYLEYYEFRLVAESLAERAVVLGLAPHLVRPQRFVMPHVPTLRPAWMIRSGLMLYDHLGKIWGRRRGLPGSEGVRLRGEPLGAGLKPEFARGFAYSDARVDDSRLVILNLVSARNHGATLLPRRRLVGARRAAGRWQVRIEHALTGETTELTTRVLVNAGGPWVKDVLDCTGGQVAAKVRLVKGSHIVVPRVHAGDHAYLLQNTDRRVIFIIPYRERFSLIGTTDVPVDSVEQSRAIAPDEIRYLIAAVNRYLAKPLAEADVVWTFSGVRPLYDDGHGDPAAITRDYTLVADESDGAPQLAIFGGKLTTYRTLGEAVLEKLEPWLDYRRAPWTDSEPLPGGDFPAERREDELRALCAAYPGLPPPWLDGLFARHGRAAAHLLDGAKDVAGLGRDFGGGLFEREVRHFVAEEWAMSADDILWRRSKAGLDMTPQQRKAFARWFAAEYPGFQPRR